MAAAATAATTTSAVEYACWAGTVVAVSVSGSPTSKSVNLSSVGRPALDIDVDGGEGPRERGGPRASSDREAPAARVRAFAARVNRSVNVLIGRGREAICTPPAPAAGSPDLRQTDGGVAAARLEARRVVRRGARPVMVTMTHD